MDRALERSEEIVLAAWKANADQADERRAALLEYAAGDLERYLERQIEFESLMEKLQSWTSPRQYAAGAALKGPGAPPDGLQLLVAGRASGYDAAAARLNQYAPGDAIWPPGALHEKAASVIADEPCRTMLLTPAARRRLEQQEEQLTLRLYRYLLGARTDTESGA